jgi:hypothetical protein
MTRWKTIPGLLITLVLLAACHSSEGFTSPVPASATWSQTTTAPPSTPLGEAPADLSEEEIKTLSSLTRLDDHPLYTMRYYGDYHQVASAPSRLAQITQNSWGCSLFAAFSDPQNMLYGRNFDWQYSPALLLLTDPPGSYASVSMVDIEYLGYDRTRAAALYAAALEERLALLDAPYLPFDGMNEMGLAIGMAAVPDGDMASDPRKPTIDSLMVMREILDHAANVAEAVEIIQSYNVDMGGGPPIHYLVADASGNAVLVEYSQGKLVVTRNDYPWHQATNFLLAEAGRDPAGRCWRYDQITARLSEADGKLSPERAMALLREVSQEITQWSVVYQMRTGKVNIAMHRRYDQAHTIEPDW